MITDEQAIDLGRLAAIVRGKPAIANRYDDAASKLAREVLEMLARREAEQSERAKPITAEWLESIGGDVPRGFDVALFHGGSVGISRISEHWMCHGIPVRNRGQLLDLLAALKGGAS